MDSDQKNDQSESSDATANESLVEENPHQDQELPPGESDAEQDATAAGQAASASPPVELKKLDLTLRRFDIVLCGIAVVLAAVLASFAAAESDIWVHLAIGRAITQGTYTFGSHPFTYISPDVYWVNPAWLYDLLSYRVFRLFGELDSFGGSALVAVKALMVLLLAVVLLRSSRMGVPRTTSLFVPALCVILALVAMAHRLQLRPVICSHLFLALICLYLRQGTQILREESRQLAASFTQQLGLCRRVYWPVFLLMAIWVNLDSWFILGLLVVFIYAVGECLCGAWSNDAEAPDASDYAGSRGSGGAILAGLVVFSVLACLLNPHHVFALRMPQQPGFSSIATILQQDPLWKKVGGSPLRPSFIRPSSGWNYAALAYLALLAAGPVAFYLRSAWTNAGSLAKLLFGHWQGLLWLVFAALSLYQARMIPFFVIAAAPITSANLATALSQRVGLVSNLQGTKRFVAVALRPLSLPAGVLLLVVVWPGWLQPTPNELKYEPRSWEFRVDPTLEQAALDLAAWEELGVLGGETNGFNSSLDIANYCAWFAPDVKMFLNASLHGSDLSISDYVTTRRQILGDIISPKRPGVYGRETVSPDYWKRVFRRHNIRYVLLHAGPGPNSVAVPAFQKMVNHSKQWSLIHLRGSLAVFAWLDPGEKPKNPLGTLKMDLAQQAYSESLAIKAPLKKAEASFPNARDWWHKLVRPAIVTSADREQAVMYLYYFNAKATGNAAKHNMLWSYSRVARLVGDFADRGNWLVPVLRSVLHADAMSSEPRLTRVTFQLFVDTKDERPVAPLFLAVREARHAVKASPYDAYAYLALGEAYGRVHFETKELAWSQEMPWLERTRVIQAISSYKEATRLKPDLTRAHDQLAFYYSPAHLNCPDLHLKHRKLSLKYKLANGITLGAGLAIHNKLVTAEQSNLAQMTKLWRDQQEKFKAQSANLPALERAKLARKLGLIEDALKILNQTDAAKLGKEGANFKWNLLMKTGRIRKLQEWTKTSENELKKTLGSENYYLLKAEYSAAVGDYDAADSFLQKMIVDESPDADPAIEEHPMSYNCKVNTLRGLLALESGQILKAGERFRRALYIQNPSDGIQHAAPFSSDARNIAIGYLKLILDYNR